MADHSNKAVQRPRILHLSADFPDPINPAKTPVIARLVDLVAEPFEHDVISLNRRTPGLGALAGLASGAVAPLHAPSVQAFSHGTCLEYLAPSRGFLHATMLERLADSLADLVEQQGSRRPDLVIGHKLTIEGILARRVAQRLGVPFAITIQGNTDAKILSVRRDLAGLFGRIFHEAACVFSFAPWALAAVSQRLGARRGPTLDLPCPTTLDQIRTPVAGGTALLSVFHLRNHHTKNLAGLTRAIRRLEARGAPVPLQVIGGGSPSETAACERIIAGSRAITLAGPRSPDELGAMMNGALALVMPSLRESFGLVFIEALFAGLPVIYPKGAAVDGYFHGLPFAIAVDARDSFAIAAALRRVIANEAAIKAALADWQAGGGLAPFTRNAIAATFEHGLRAALGESTPNAPRQGRR